MGVGHVPKEPVRAEGARTQFQRPQRRRTSTARGLAASAQARVARGQWAEQHVARWYQQHGYVIVARNWRSKRGELDVVAMLHDVLVVCEVKARATLAMGTPAEAVTVAKQLKIRRATADYRQALREANDPLSTKIRSVRFDVACVLGTQLEMLLDAF